MKKLLFIILLPIYVPLAFLMHYAYEPWVKLASHRLLAFFSKYAPFVVMAGHWTDHAHGHGPKHVPPDHPSPKKRLFKNAVFLILLPFMSPAGFLMRETFEEWAELWG